MITHTQPKPKGKLQADCKASTGTAWTRARQLQGCATRPRVAKQVQMQTGGLKDTRGQTDLPRHIGQGSSCAILPSQLIRPVPLHSLHL